jgi:hypothetical protein
MKTNPVISICAGALHVDIAPAVGGSIARFYSKEKSQTVEWMRPASREGLAEGNPQMMACFPLVPFSGRVRDGRFVFAGRHITLPRNFGNSPHAIHGNAWQLPWRIIGHDAASASIVLEHERGDWPFAYRAEQHFALTPRSRLIVKHTTRTVKALVRDLHYRLDVNTLHREEGIDRLGLNEIGRTTLRLTQPLFCDPYSRNRQTGGLILIDEATSSTVGAAMITEGH